MFNVVVVWPVVIVVGIGSPAVPLLCMRAAAFSSRFFDGAKCIKKLGSFNSIFFLFITAVKVVAPSNYDDY